MHTETTETTTAAQEYRRLYRDRADHLAEAAKHSRLIAESEDATEEDLRELVRQLASLADMYSVDVIQIVNLHAELEEKTEEAEQWQAGKEDRR